MAKSRRNRAGARKDPLAKPVKPPSDPELAALREAKILPVIKDLKSTDTKKRTAAASAISNIIQDTKCRKLLLREQVVHTVLNETITDTALESRAAGWGILQVLAQEEEADFCVHLFRSDVLTAIEYAAKNFTQTITTAEPSFSKLPKAEQTTIISIVASLLSLITALAEAGDDILEAIASNTTLTQLLVVLITKHDDISGDSDGVSTLRADALACLMLLCEDNEKLAQAISVAGNNTFETLLSLKDRLDGEGVLACAVLHNLFASLETSRDASIPIKGDESVWIPTLTKVLASYSPDAPAPAGESWSDPAQYQQLALESLASIGTSLTAAIGGPAEATKAVGKNGAPAPKAEDAGDDMDMNEADDDAHSASGDEGMDEEEDDDEMTHEEMQADMDMVLGGDDDESIDDLPVLQALLQQALPELIRIAASQPANEVAMSMQGHALSALNNIAWSLSVVDFAEPQNAGMLAAWSPAAKSIWEQVISPILASDTADLGLATQVTGLSWAVARALRSNTPLQPGEQRKFITLYQATRSGAGATSAEPQDQEDDPFQSLGVKCIGVVGQLAIDPCPADTNRELGTFLVAVVAELPRTPPAEAVEALNQLFDVYGDEAYAYDADVFWAGGFAARLEEALPRVRAMAKAVDKQAHPELRLRADEVVMNLPRFIAYKAKNKPKN
ncbi:Armadillo-type fold domain containing protein [Cordyceps fumosorosea ARSEF 2679]|uniref:Armadillo-type fold domain containing protein n=1 Tax=Cordyceps fumosorosea (strain ARSEF 2679) TaxID=1081104 RepID=A0A162MR72_CORFA|nr:Armadillo-type fold domain containing protein [Cordyceps fumosorosea ARSEF 2679]OAA68909.1 Armadillo-type fold domain containing protein [Cordyceps fumosorosea ARSEF 2679]